MGSIMKMVVNKTAINLQSGTPDGRRATKNRDTFMGPGVFPHFMGIYK